MKVNTIDNPMSKASEDEDADQETNDHRLPCQMCSGVSVNFAASFAVILLSALSFVIALSTSNWSASGHKMKMGLWDYCITHGQNVTWTCYPVNTDFSVATQSFSILTAMCYACAFVLYILFLIFDILRRSRPLTIAICLVAFFTVCLEIMTLVVFGAKNRELYNKIQRDYFKSDLDELYISWSFYCACISAILGTATGVLLFLEFRNLAYESVYSSTADEEEVNANNVT